jgi:hypothetical protein
MLRKALYVLGVNLRSFYVALSPCDGSIAQ